MPSYSHYELAFFSAIHAEPRDDAPRLIYADWLDENDQPEYAQFIRLQCQAARRVGILSESEYTVRERVLVNKFGARWRGGEAKTGGKINSYLRFRRFHRGLPDVECCAAGYFRDARYHSFPPACLAPHYQLTVLLTFCGIYRGNPLNLLGHSLFRRAQRIYVRALSGVRSEVPVAENVVAAAVETFRTRKLLSIRFGPVSDKSKALIKARLAPHVTTITSAMA